MGQDLVQNGQHKTGHGSVDSTIEDQGQVIHRGLPGPSRVRVVHQQEEAEGGVLVEEIQNEIRQPAKDCVELVCACACEGACMCATGAAPSHGSTPKDVQPFQGL